MTVYRRLIFVAREIDESPLPGEAELELEFEELGAGALPEYARLRTDARPGDAAGRLRRGQCCILARHRGEIVNARWYSVQRAEVPYLGLAFELAPGVGYVYDVFTAPAARGRRVGAVSRLRCEALLREAGAKALLGTVMPENRAGLGLVEGAGYRPLGTVGCLRLGPARVPVRRIPAGYLGASMRFS